MSDVAVKVENIGKLYRLGEVGTGTISHDINRWWAKMLGKDDPYSIVGQINDRTRKGGGDYVWALKGINFEVKKGEVMGIIGRNGAGKSTLLKILSKVTTPTEGSIKLKGRVASLLEVGTGFHPELTGRENIYLNGTILGMTKADISKKLDEIVEFAGIERYIDTPVKRYSTGMYVRLAFSVAAFLNTDILIVDEVLAVGDIEFQKKCIGRMKDLSYESGRTVLFVSHNIPAIQLLCESGLLLENGRLSQSGSVDFVLNKYFEDSILNDSKVMFNEISNRQGSGQIRITSASIFNDSKENVNTIQLGRDLSFIVSYQILDRTFDIAGLHFSVNVFDQFGTIIVNHTNKLVGTLFSVSDILNNNKIQFNWKGINLTPGKYNVSFDIVSFNQYIDNVQNAISFYIEEGVVYNYRVSPNIGIFAINAEWSFVK